jgi:hypothetical protein
MTPREIATALIANKAVPASRKQFMDLQAAMAMRKRDGRIVMMSPPKDQHRVSPGR